MAKQATKLSINDLLGEPTSISGVNAESGNIFSKIAFDLYKETSLVAILASGLYESKSPNKDAILRNQAIEVGLLIRMAKFMAAVMALLLDKVREHGEVIMALNRCISESAIKLRFFCEKATPQDFDDFVKSSLRPEKELYLAIQENIAKRGKTLPIEVRILDSINRVFQNSNLKKIEELDSIPSGKTYESILKALGIGSLYLTLQRIPSHAVHGTWVDIVSHHLEKWGAGFKPKPDATVPDARLLCPLNTVILTAIKSYLNKHFSNFQDEIPVLLVRINDLIDRNIRFDSLHEDWLAKRAEKKDKT